jgi:hypothetical protein
MSCNLYGPFQVFTAVVTELESGELVSNLTALSSPSFALTGLRAEQEFLLSLYASNSKGRSKEVVLHGTTPKLEVAERPTDQGRCSRRQVLKGLVAICHSYRNRNIHTECIRS